MDSSVLNLTRSVKYAHRRPSGNPARQLTEQYLSDYTATARRNGQP